MTSINFPNLTIPPTPPYSIEYEDVVLRSAMDGPYTLTRSRFTRGRMKPVSLTWNLLPHNDYTTLMNFFVSTIKNGALSFNFTFPIMGETGITKEMLLQSPPKTRYMGMGLWEINLTMEEVL